MVQKLRKTTPIAGGRVQEAHFKPTHIRPRYERDQEITPRLIKARERLFEKIRKVNPGPSDPAMVSSAFGRFDLILLTMSKWVARDPASAATYRDLLAKLPRRLKYIILVHTADEPHLRRWLGELNLTNKVTIVIAPRNMHFTVWAEDAYAIVQSRGEGKSYFVEPSSFRRFNDNKIAPLVSKHTGLCLDRSHLVFQGGNMLCGDDFWLIGGDYPRRSKVKRLVGETRKQAEISAYEAMLNFDRRLHIVATSVKVPAQSIRTVIIDGKKWTEEKYRGNSRGTVQPIFHIDMFITLAGRDAHGKRIVLVGDPRLADEILGWADAPPEAMPEAFDDIAEQFREQGFTVIRTPLPLLCQTRRSDRTRLWYFATSNNALVEINGSEKNVWIPTYAYGNWKALKATDDEHERIWKSLGFKVHRLGDFHPFAVNLGAVHCVKKYLSRSSAAQPSFG